MTWQLEPHVSVAETEDGMVLLNERTGKYFQLNNTGVRVLREGADAVVAELAARHPRIRDDVVVLEAALRTAGLVRS